LSAVDELAVCDGWPGGGASEQEIGQVGDASAAIEAIVPLARIARQVLGADAMEGAVEPGLHVAEQDVDDGQHGIGVFAAVLDDRGVAEAVGEAAIALQTISDDAGAGLGGAAGAIPGVQAALEASVKYTGSGNTFQSGSNLFYGIRFYPPT